MEKAIHFIKRHAAFFMAFSLAGAIHWYDDGGWGWVAGTVCIGVFLASMELRYGLLEGKEE
jgi:hypothetical protein